MSNVLPHKARKTIWSMYRARFIIAGSCVGIAVALFAFIALLPSYLVLQVGGSTQPVQERSDSAAIQQDRAAIARAQALLTTLSSLALSTTSPSKAIRESLVARPFGISIKHINLTSGTPGTLVVAGTASTIEAINEYRKALTASGQFSSVSVPVGDLAGTQNGQFSMTLTGTF